MNKKIDILIIIINIFFLYFAVQLLVFTDEFAKDNLVLIMQLLVYQNYWNHICYFQYWFNYNIIQRLGRQLPVFFQFLYFN